MKPYPIICLFVLCGYFGYSQSIYQKDTLTILADSLHDIGEYERAITLRNQAIKAQVNASKAYKAYLNAKYHHTNSSLLEFKSYSYHDPDKAITKKAREQYLDSALQAAIKARDLYSDVEHPDRMFKYQIQNRIFHQTAYLGNWKHALEQAEIGYQYLKDTLTTNDKMFVDLIYDIGFIYSKLGDYSKSVEHYQKSLDLYKTIIGENNHDVALSYNNIAVEYRKIGLRKKELESLLKAKTIWEQLNGAGYQKQLYTCYGNLFYWYSYYGDFDKAEEYLLKKDKLRTIAKTTEVNELLRNKEEIYQNKLTEWYDVMVHYSRKKDTAKTIFYADTILKTINTDKDLLGFEVSFVSAASGFYARIIEGSNLEEALRIMDKSIAIQEKYKDIYYTNSDNFKLGKVKFLVKAKQYKEAALILKQLEHINKSASIAHQFNFAILHAKTAEGLEDSDKAKTYFDAAFVLLNNSEKNIENLTTEDLKPLISFEIINGFLDMGDFYLRHYKDGQTKDMLKKATNRYVLAAEIYNQLYLGERYNESLFTTYNAINERLLNVALEQSNDIRLLSKILNSIENNGSKLTWSKFVFNNQRQQLNIPANLISQEENIKAQLNFYQDALVNGKKNSEEKTTLWKTKIYELKNDLLKIQDSIKQQNQTYYQFNVQNFEIINLQKSLKEDELLIKYVMTDSSLFSFLVSKNRIELLPPKEKATVLLALKTGLNALKNREPNYQESFKELQTLLLNKIDYQMYRKLTIIPDGALHYFPFEALILDENMPLLSYSSSLLLYQEQKKVQSTYNTINVGAFSASNTISKLPKASQEINSILKIFEGTTFFNASKADFVINANAFNVLHLAMHSKIDDVHPEFSSLDFYGEKDNELFISELYNESLNANMAVLSACDTGSGFYENGEGVISLSRAFNYAGIPSTVMSLWKVDDEATAQIMTYFYRHLKQGQAKDEALKNAKLEYLKNTEDELLKHPYYWSGFVVTGNTDALVETQNYWMYLLLLPIIVVVFFRKRLVQLFKK